MDKVLAALMLYLRLFQAAAGHVEPRCSKYEFEEKVLEKVIRFEYKMELMMDSVKNFKESMDNLKTEWIEAKKELETMKHDLNEQQSVINETIHSELNTFRESVGDIAGNYI